MVFCKKGTGGITVNAQGVFSINVPAADLVADNDTQIEASITGTGGSKATALQNYAVDTTAHVASVTLNPLTPDNLIDAAEAGQPTLPVTGKVTGEFTPGDQVTVMVNGNPYKGTVKPDGSFSINVPTVELIADPDTKYEVTVALTDGSGNPGTASGVNDYVTPSDSKVAISLTPVTGDNIITLAEGSSPTTILGGKVTGAFTAGDVITFFVNDKTFTTIVAADGTYSKAIATSELKADSDTKVEVSISANDPINGKLNIVGSAQDYTVETDGTNGSNNTAGKTVALSIDPVTTDTFKGVAITAAGTAAEVANTGTGALGHYQLSKDGGTSWIDVAGGLTDTNAVYADKTALIRYVGATGVEAINPQNLTARLIDNSGLTGTSSYNLAATGTTINASVNGGSTAFSGGNSGGTGDTVTINLLNRAPASSDADGVVVGDAFGAAAPSVYTDVALPSGFSTGVNGILLGNNNADQSGTFVIASSPYSVKITFLPLNGGAEVARVNINGTPFDLRLADIAMANYVDASNVATPVISTDGYSVGSVSGRIDAGTITIFAKDVPGGLINSVTVTADLLVPGTGGANGFWASVKTGTGLVSAPQSVEALFGGTYTDADFDTMRGVVITSAGTASDVTNLGKYQYSTNGGTTWVDLAGGLGDSTSVFLAKTDLVRFVPSSTNTSLTNKQDLTARLVDDSATTAPVSGATVDVSGALHGGSTAYSGNAVTLHVPVAPIVLDLNHDGTLSYGSAVMDVNHDGHLDNTAWAGSQEGVLVWDKLGDGKVVDNSQYAFSQYGPAGSTDLQGLAAGFDSNHDGVFSALDAKFAEFKVWQDANGNGVSDAGEVRSLANWGIAQINLVSDGVHRTPAAGVTEAGQSTASLADGSTMLVSDASFNFVALDYSLETTAPAASKLVLNGESMSLDLSSIIAAHQSITEVDLTGSGTNTLKLNLSDVLSLPTTNGMHKLTLTGDANDFAQVNLPDWLDTGTQVSQNGHTYAVYSASMDSSAQLLIDQQLLQAHHVS